MIQQGVQGKINRSLTLEILSFECGISDRVFTVMCGCCFKVLEIKVTKNAVKIKLVDHDGYLDNSSD